MTDVLVLQRADAPAQLRPLAGVRYVPATCDELPRRLLADIPPALLIIDAAMLAQRTVQLIETLSRRQLLPQTAVWLGSSDAGSMSTAWQLARYNVAAAFTLDELHQLIRECTQLYLGTPADYLQHRCQVICTRSIRLLALLERQPETRMLPMDPLAQLCGAGRTQLYSCVTRAGLPAPEQLQMLFRLWPAVTSLRRGGTIDQSARAAAFADGRSLRRALQRRFGCTVTQIRGMHNWRDIIDAWLEHHTCATAVRSVPVAVR